MSEEPSKEKVTSKEAGDRLIEIFKGDAGSVTREQLSHVLAALMRVEDLFARLLQLMTEIRHSPEGAAKAGDNFLEVMAAYKLAVGTAARLALDEASRKKNEQ